MVTVWPMATRLCSRVATIVKTTAATAAPVATAPMTVVVRVLAVVVPVALVAPVQDVVLRVVTSQLPAHQPMAATSLLCPPVPLMLPVPSVFARPLWPKRKENKHVAT